MEKSGAWIIHKPSEGTELTAMKTQLPHYLEEHRLIHSHGAWVGPYFNQCLLMCLQLNKNRGGGGYFHREISQEFFCFVLGLFLASRVMEKAHKRYMDAPINLSIIPGFVFFSLWWWWKEGLEVDGAKQERHEAGDAAQWLRIIAVLTEDPCSVPNTYMMAHSCPQLQFQDMDLMPSSGSHRLCTHLMHLYPCRPTITHTIKTNVKIKKKNKIKNTVLCGLLQLTKIKLIVV